MSIKPIRDDNDRNHDFDPPDPKVGTMDGKAKPERALTIDEMNEIIAAGWAGEIDDSPAAEMPDETPRLDWNSVGERRICPAKTSRSFWYA